MRTATLAGILALLLLVGTGAALMAATGQDVTAPTTAGTGADANNTTAGGNATGYACNGTGHGFFGRHSPPGANATAPNLTAQSLTNAVVSNELGWIRLLSGLSPAARIWSAAIGSL